MMPSRQWRCGGVVRLAKRKEEKRNKRTRGIVFVTFILYSSHSNSTTTTHNNSSHTDRQIHTGDTHTLTLTAMPKKVASQEDLKVQEAATHEKKHRKNKLSNRSSSSNTAPTKSRLDDDEQGGGKKPKLGNTTANSTSPSEQKTPSQQQKQQQPPASDTTALAVTPIDKLPIKRALRNQCIRMGYRDARPVQVACIPPILKGKRWSACVCSMCVQYVCARG